MPLSSCCPFASFFLSDSFHLWYLSSVYYSPYFFFSFHLFFPFIYLLPPTLSLPLSLSLQLSSQPIDLRDHHGSSVNPITNVKITCKGNTQKTCYISSVESKCSTLVAQGYSMLTTRPHDAHYPHFSRLGVGLSLLKPPCVEAILK